MRDHEKNGVKVVKIPEGPDGLLSMTAALEALGAMECQSVLIEAGGTVAASALISEKVVDLVHVFIAPKLIGGSEAPGMLGGEGVLNIRDAPELDIISLGKKGPDVHLTLRPKEGFRAALNADGTLGLAKEEEEPPVG